MLSHSILWHLKCAQGSPCFHFKDDNTEAQQDLGIYLKSQTWQNSDQTCQFLTQPPGSFSDVSIDILNYLFMGMSLIYPSTSNHNSRFFLKSLSKLCDITFAFKNKNLFLLLDLLPLKTWMVLFSYFWDSVPSTLTKRAFANAFLNCFWFLDLLGGIDDALYCQWPGDYSAYNFCRNSSVNYEIERF